jgi:glycosyltransferase involved in cell wall biosynthesis
MRRILLLVRFPVGGIRTHLKYFYPLMSREIPDLELTLIVPRTDEAEILERDLSSLPVRYLYLPPQSSPLVLAATVSRELGRAGYDLVHSHGFTAASVAAPIAAFRRIPHVATAHEPLQDSQFVGLAGVARKWGMKLLLGRVDVIVAVSADIQRNLAAHLGSRVARRVRVVRNGVLTRPVLEARPRELRTELRLNDDSLLIGFFGRFMPPKGFRYLVEAIHLLQQRAGGRAFHVAAFGSGGFIREERAAIERAGMALSFTFLPFVPDVASALKAVDVVVIPSLWEASSLLGMEAMVAGVPVIGTSCIGLSEVLADTPATIVPAANGAAIANALEREALISSRAVAQAFIPTAVARFDVAARALELSAIVRQLSQSKAQIRNTN